ncbi:serine/threonine-protein kinase [Actinomyces faecalis]|uniref:serine/threonine-protein kinase n=1 Tax=Actinomyces faecalis TaxID=2722820 RepID=UPI001C12E2C0
MELQGRYELIERIALGGMGEVWQATDLRSGRAVAAKILRPELTGDEIFLSRLRAEAANSRGLRHPNLAVVLDSGERDGSGWIIMELVQGRALSDLLSEQGTMQAGEILPILAQVARALQVVHDAGVVHRDVKPSNILINREGLAKLTDFGISTGVHQRPLTATGMVMGTAQYLSPEQAMGHMATPAGDLYALGVIAYEALVGHRPFTGATQVDIAFAHVNEPVPPLPDGVNPEVREIVMELLAKDPGSRPRSAREVARRLDRIVIHLPKESWDPRGQLSWVATGRQATPARHDTSVPSSRPRPGTRHRREATGGTRVPTRQIPAAWRTRSAVAARAGASSPATDDVAPRHSSGRGLLGLPTSLSWLIVLGLVAALTLIVTIGTLAAAHSAPGSGAGSSVTSPKETL